ncbi:hypothetical protein YC2023_073302 [Brassica napus]
MNRFITLFLYVSHIYSVNQCQFTFATPPPFRLIYTLSYERNPTALILSTILPPIKLYFTFSKMISSAAPVAKAVVSGTGQSYSRTEEINNAFANEVSWDRSSMSSTQAPTHRPSKRTYGAIQTVNFLCLRFCLSQW